MADDRPDTARVLEQLKGFQRDTVEYVFKRLYTDQDSSHRFLVADEVGLGKTLVARGVIAKAIDELWEKVGRIDVIYICSNADIARQNINRLNLTGNREFALASRITLLPLAMRDLEGHKLNFISFTPGTSFQLTGGGGVRTERMLLYWLLKEHWGFGGAAPLNIFQGWIVKKDRYRKQLRDFIRSGPGGARPYDATLAEAFYEGIEEENRKNRADGKPDLKERFDLLCKRFGYARKHIPTEDGRDRDRLIGDLRNVLAKACLQALEPDLVILDEFQRFRDLLDGTDPAAELARDLFTYADETTKVRVLLLSATPYKMYTLSHEVEEDDHYKDFTRTAQFLLRSDRRSEKLAALLKDYRGALYDLARGETSELIALKEAVQQSLRSVMSRAERIKASAEGDGMLREVLSPHVKLDPKDVRDFSKLQSLARELDQSDITEFWKSAPYLLNFMDKYKFKETFRERVELDQSCDSEIGRSLRENLECLLPWNDIEAYRAFDCSNARLRGFIEDALASESWKCLWLPPAAPYYQLQNPFLKVADHNFTKRLVFSTWAVVPRAVSTLVSYEVERRIFKDFDAHAKNTPDARRSRRPLLNFSYTDERLTGLPIFTLIYPSAALAQLGSQLPLGEQMDGLPTLRDALQRTKNRLKDPLQDVTKDAPRFGPEDESWYWAAAILLDLKVDPNGTREWFEARDLADHWTGRDGDEDASSRWLDHVEQAKALIRGEIDLGRPPDDLLDVVALQALGAPATAVLRSLSRVSQDTVDFDRKSFRDAAAQIGWAFRSLFNQPESSVIIRTSYGGVPYWQMVLRYCAAGCLSAVLDEYLHLQRDFLGLFDSTGDKLAEELVKAIMPVIGLRTSNLRIDEINADGEEILIRDRRLRARFAMRFGSEKSESEKDSVREDLVRGAFNSPFWPFVLVSTSIGQEGLDFHPYCHAVVHWNLPANPVDLEQREGRVHRFKGHAIRKNIARSVAQTALAKFDGDPWQRMFEQAAELGDGTDRGLVPYWIFPIEDGAHIERHVPALPLSREVSHLAALRRSLAVYRMVFGQPRQDDLMSYLLENVDPELVDANRDLLQIDLSAPHAVI